MKRKAISLIGVSLLIISTFMLYACLPSDSSESDPYSVRVYDTTSEANPAYVMVQGLITDNATIYALLEDGSLTTLDGIVIGDGSVISAIPRPGGDVVGTTETQVITNKTITLGGTLTINGQEIDLGSNNMIVNTSAIPGGIIIISENDGALSTQYAGIHISTSPATNDDVLRLTGVGYDLDTPQNQCVYGYMVIEVQSAVANEHSGRYKFFTYDRATENLAASISSEGTIWVDKDLLVDEYLQLSEMTAPGAGSANTVRIYASEGGDTLTDLNAVYQDGTIDIFSQESTPLDSPIFSYSSDTEVVLKMVKPHPGLIQFAIVYPDGSKFVIREIEYHDADKIAANTGYDSPVLPDGWEVLTVAERVQKNVKAIDDLLNTDTLDIEQRAKLEAEKATELEGLRLSE